MGLFCVNGHTSLPREDHSDTVVILSHTVPGISSVLVTTSMCSLRSLRTCRLGQKRMQFLMVFVILKLPRGARAPLRVGSMCNLKLTRRKKQQQMKP